MQTYISVLRGINVSGQKSIKMADLKAMYEGLGLSDVKTYIQSGNVIFKAESTDKVKLTGMITAQIMSTFGFEVPVLVKTIEEWEKVTLSNPFAARGEEHKKMYVTLLSAIADQNHIAQITPGIYGDDEFHIIDDVVYLFYPTIGYGNTKLSNNFFEKKLKLNATTRNWATMNKLLELAKEHDGNQN